MMKKILRATALTTVAVIMIYAGFSVHWGMGVITVAAWMLVISEFLL